MFGISYETWKNTCEMYLRLGRGTKARYLQWFPFTKLTSSDWDYLSGEEFYHKYIESGAFVLSAPAMHRSENYIQKSDGSFRDSSLLSPILYLVLQAIGKEISTSYSDQRNDNTVVFYGGNYNRMRPYYKQDYDTFFKAINESIEEYQFFIKTDISNYFSNVNVDTLVNRIDLICNSTEVIFSQAQLSILKELLLYCGGGRFPLVENSIASSYLATVVYLDEVDKKLSDYIASNINVFDSFRIIRYVDDMYILISSSHSEAEIHAAYNQIRSEYSSILREYDLALNTKKCCIRPSIEINDELKKSLYDENYYGEDCEIESLFSGALTAFLDEMLSELKKECLSVERYNSLIDKHFSNDSIEFTATEVFNYFVYDDTSEVTSDAVRNAIVELLNHDQSFISFDPQRLTSLIIKSNNTCAIKALLNRLFNRHRAGLWNSYDTIIAISYLIQSEFRHIDLIGVLCKNSPAIKNYYQFFCQKRFAGLMHGKQMNRYCKITQNDWKANYLYFMYVSAQSKHNHLSKFAFFKTFFDRITADIAFFTNFDPSDKSPNYQNFYKKNMLKKVYVQIPNADDVIEKASKIRNANPLSHSSAELIDKDSTTNDIDEIIKQLKKIVEQYLAKNIS